MDGNASAQTATSGRGVLGVLGAGSAPQGLVLNRQTRRALARQRRRPARVGSAGGQPALVGSRPGGRSRRAGRRLSSESRPRPRRNGGSGRGGLGLDVTPPAFEPIASALLFGPPADVSMGWDGALWAIDAVGAAHCYDPLAERWLPHGAGVDAVAITGDSEGDLIYHFRGNSYVTVAFGPNQTLGPPTPIGTTWPTLPPSFKLGVDGAAYVNGQLYLFRGGRYLHPEPGPAGLAPQVFKLTDLAGWPQTPTWQQGAIDAVCSQPGSDQAVGEAGEVWLLCSGEYITVDLPNRQVTSQPAPISGFAPWQGHLPSDWAAGGIDAGFRYRDPQGIEGWTLYRGPALCNFRASEGLASPLYLGTVNHGWPAAWNPVLAHAPGGRVGDLYAATTGGGVLCHDGQEWTALVALPDSGQARSVAAGRDGTVYAATSTTLHQWGGQGWSPGVTPGVGVGQVAVGDATRVWVRDTSNQVHRLSIDGTRFQPSTLVGAATDLAANADGTLWHCNATDANAYRFISEGTETPEPIPLPPGADTAQASVQKVASTGFGNAYCLVQPAATGAQADAPAQLYAYSSNYLFKTSESYNPPAYGTIAQGLGRLYFITEGGKDPDGRALYYVVALDAQTGREVARSQQWDLTMTSPVFDPVNELVYVANASNSGLGPDGQFKALDARTLGLVWQFVTGTDGGPDTNIPAPPALQGTQLCFGDNHGMVYLFDTVAVLQQTRSSQTPTPVWKKQGPSDAYALVQPPVFSDGSVYVCTWTAASAAGEASVHVQQLAVLDASVLFDNEFAVPDWEASQFVPVAPVLCTLEADNAPSPALVLNGYDRIFAFFLGSGPLTDAFQAEPGAWFSSGMTYEAGTWTNVNGTPTYSYGRLWVGDSAGRLYALDGNLQPTANTPIQPRSGDAVQTTPVVYTDSAGDTYMLFGAYGSASRELWIFDPTKPAGQANPVSVATGQTAISQLSATVTNGVVYATGTTDWTTGNLATGQVFAINVDRATQALRDLIVESQLMQDFDEPPEPKADPPTHARYQTHLTVVDDLKTPRPFEPVKLWADQPTSISINDAAPVQIGPGDDQYVAAQTGADGSLTIATGSLKSDGSDDADLFATPLRIWAGFMDPYERVVVYPDREFHKRVTTARAISSTTDPNYDNPDVVNLQAAQSYDKTPLFTDQEKSPKENQPQQVASAIQTMTTAIDVTTGGPPPDGPGRSGRQRAVAAAAGKYLAYANLPGAAYFPANTPATRPVTVLQPIGLSYASNDDDSVPASFSTLAHADATAAIDALDGLDWTQAEGAGPLLGKSIFRSFWDFLKGVAAEVTHVVISIGKEIYAGIRFIIKGIAYVFQHPLQALEDVIGAVGAFFKKLAKDIKNVLQALSVLFHFDEIIKTHRLLRDELLNRINGVPGNQDYPGYVNLIHDNVLPNVNQFFAQGEDAIKKILNDAKAKLDPNQKQKISDVKGAGSTATTVFTVGPKVNGAPASSHSVACTWAMRKLQNGQQQASITTVTGPPAAVSDSPFMAFINGFADRLRDDGDLHGWLAATEADINKLFSAKSAKEFLERGLSVLLDALALLVTGVLAVTSAFIDGLLCAFAALLDFLFHDKTGLLTRTLHIPVLSALYHMLLPKEELTVLNLLMLVLAIPVTIVYRVISGHYPSQDLQPTGQLQGVNLVALRNAFGVLGIIATFAGGIINMMADFAAAAGEGAASEGELKFLGVAGLCLGIFMQGATEPNVLAMKPEAFDWTVWGLAFGPVVAALVALAAERAGEAAAKFADKAASVVLCLCSVVIVIVASIAFAKSPLDDPAIFGFASLLLVSLPGIANPLKYAGDPIGFIAGVLDLLGGTGSAFCQFAVTDLNWDKPVGQARAAAQT